MLSVIVAILFFLIPLSSIVFFIVSLCFYLSTKKKSKVYMDYNTQKSLKLYLTLLIISSIIMGILVATVIGFILTLSIALRNM